MYCICKNMCQTDKFKKEYDMTKAHKNASGQDIQGAESVNTISRA